MVVGENQTSATCLIFTLVQWSPYSPTSPTPTHKQVNKQTNKCGLKKKGVLCPALAYWCIFHNSTRSKNNNCHPFLTSFPSIGGSFSWWMYPHRDFFQNELLTFQGIIFSLLFHAIDDSVEFLSFLNFIFPLLFFCSATLGLSSTEVCYSKNTGISIIIAFEVCLIKLLV